ncbi:polysaccharide deacetylase family protein [Pseudonocardia sp. D17]|uniref:polysaccharide deacetylase family protein n=1 Tax=Pseudonocardia sp. D17 TaxID=882661 RepID=UPI002B38D222|nr:putative polysaccharide deacetylase [Pseudonocardia sp. D17]
MPRRPGSPLLRRTVDRRSLLMLAVGTAALLSGCGHPGDTPGPTPGAPAAVPPLPPVPGPHPGPNQVLSHGPTGATDRRIALTVDDGTAPDVVAGYVDFAQRTGIHLTFSPNGTYNRSWAPHAPVLRPLVATGQVQIINHTFTHRDLRKLGDADRRTELERNDDWVVTTFGVTTRPYYRPPFGFRTPAIDALAGELGYTRTVLWDGSFSDSETVTPEFLMGMARKYLQPGVINLGHANHPTILGLFDQVTDLIRQRRLTPVTLDEMFGTSRATG